METLKYVLVRLFYVGILLFIDSLLFSLYAIILSANSTILNALGYVAGVGTALFSVWLFASIGHNMFVKISSGTLDAETQNEEPNNETKNQK